jgi:flagellar motor protein MotB
MEAVALSKYRPVAADDTPEQLARNRRVEIVLTAPRPSGGEASAGGGR